MNVIIGNEQQDQLANLDIDVIKNITGTYEPAEIVDMFKNFFYSKMILDVTAIKHYTEVRSYETIAKGLDPGKIIFFLPEGSTLCAASFLSNLIDLGIYNFTTNFEGIKYLLKKSNTLKDVESIKQMGATGAAVVTNNITNVQSATGLVATKSYSSNSIVLGFKNITDHAGATTLIYMLKGEIASSFGKENVVALEVDKNDFALFNDKSMLSIKSTDINSTINRLNVKIVLLDLNGINDSSMCSEVFHLIEPSTIKLNKLIRRNRAIFTNLQNRKVILNQSMLLNNDIADFESEANIKVFFNLPPLDERKKNDILKDFLIKIGLVNRPIIQKKENSGKIFGLFRR